jgi:DNA repair protein RadC
MEERYTVAIKEMPSEERPRERLQRYGAQALSTAELLAIVLRTGTKERSAIGLAEHLLSVHGGLRGVANASVDELALVKGLGPVKGVQIAACVELGRRLAAHTDDSRPCIRTPEDVAHLLMPKLRDARKENFVALLMDTKNRVVKEVIVSVGTLDASIVHPREVFKDAVASSAAAVIVAHNHPSGDPTPSPEDRQVTARLCEAGRVMGIEVLDHVVVGDGRWVSLKQLGWM